MTRAILALAAIAVGWAVVRVVRLARALEREELRARISMAVQMENEADDSEAVMVPMTWSVPPGYYVELAPTSRN